MIIRSAEDNDNKTIVELLRLSLGESLMPKSEAYWQWKHVDNPFGTSPVFVAEEDNCIIGVRAFMRWEWQKGSNKITAIRAVDTAIHPDHQGKGIFKKLTLGLLEECQQNGVDMVYNTPNTQSKPGYLKMGWEEAGKLPVKISIKRPLGVIKAKLTARNETSFLELSNSGFSLKAALENCKEEASSNNHWQTTYSRAYLRWRYLQIPIIPYYCHSDDNSLVIFRLKQSGLGVELRICDTFGDEQNIQILLKEIYLACPFDYMTISGFSTIPLPGLLKKSLSIGPDVTIRSLAKTDILDFKNFTSWHPTFGDMEVF